MAAAWVQNVLCISSWVPTTLTPPGTFLNSTEGETSQGGSGGRAGGLASVAAPFPRLVGGRAAEFRAAIWAGSIAFVAYSKTPPGLTSSLFTLRRNPSAPHHDSMPAAVVQRSQSSSRVALIVRSITILPRRDCAV